MQQKSIKLNFILNATLSVLNLIFPLITYPYVTRILGPDNLGKVRFVSSFVEYFVLFSQLGIPYLGIREVAKVRDDKEQLSKLVQELLIINLVASVIAYILLGACLLTVPKVIDNRILVIVFSLNIFIGALGLEWMYKGLEEYGYITIRSVIFKVISVIAIFLLIHNEDDYIVYGAILVLALSGSYICNFIHARKYISFKPMCGYEFTKHIKKAMLFLGMSAATTIYLNLDSVMLGFMKGDTEVGYYDTAVRVKNILVALITSLGAVVLPRASYYIDQGKIEEFKSVTAKALDLVWCASLPCVIYCIMFAYPIVMVLAGSEYEPSVTAMVVITPTIFLIGMSNIFGIQMLVPLGKEKSLLVAEICGAIVDLVLNAILIPKLGATGAAIGTLAAEFVVMIIAHIALGNNIGQGLKSISFTKIIVSLAVTSIISMPIVWLNISPIYIVLISGVTFFGIYGLMLLISGEKMANEAIEILKSKLRK